MLRRDADTGWMETILRQEKKVRSVRFLNLCAFECSVTGVFQDVRHAAVLPFCTEVMIEDVWKGALVRRRK